MSAGVITEPLDAQKSGRRWQLSFWHSLPFFAVMFSVWTWAQQLRDIDQYWHVLIGQDILANWRFTGDPAWTFGPSNDSWVTTQWLAEVGMAFGYELFGWRAGLYSVIIIGSGLLLWWGWLLLQPGPGLIPRAMVYLAVVVIADSQIQERPNLVSFVFLTFVALGLKKWLVEGWWPRWWLPPLLVVVWAQFHGSWVLIPAVMVLAAAADWAVRQREPGSRRLLFDRLLWAVFSGVVAILTPAGVYGLFAVARVGAAASPFISEWQPTNVASPLGVGIVFMIGLVAIAWARSRGEVPVREIIVVCALIVFALLAFRNAMPGVILLAPIVAMRVQQSWPTPMAETNWLDTAVVVFAAGLAFAAIAFSFYRVVTTDVLAASDIDVEVVEALNAAEGERRVFNDYNVSGPLQALTDDHVRVAIDGRSDRYGADVIEQHLGIADAKPGWRDYFEEFRPTDVVMESDDDPILDALKEDGWRVVVDNGTWVYLTAPEDGVGE